MWGIFNSRAAWRDSLPSPGPSSLPHSLRRRREHGGGREPVGPECRFTAVTRTFRDWPPSLEPLPPASGPRVRARQPKQGTQQPQEEQLHHRVRGGKTRRARVSTKHARGNEDWFFGVRGKSSALSPSRQTVTHRPRPQPLTGGCGESQTRTTAWADHVAAGLGPAAATRLATKVLVPTQKYVKKEPAGVFSVRERDFVYCEK